MLLHRVRIRRLFLFCGIRAFNFPFLCIFTLFVHLQLSRDPFRHFFFLLTVVSTSIRRFVAVLAADLNLKRRLFQSLLKRLRPSSDADGPPIPLTTSLSHRGGFSRFFRPFFRDHILLQRPERRRRIPQTLGDLAFNAGDLIGKFLHSQFQRLLGFFRDATTRCVCLVVVPILLIIVLFPFSRDVCPASIAHKPASFHIEQPRGI